MTLLPLTTWPHRETRTSAWNTSGEPGKLSRHSHVEAVGALDLGLAAGLGGWHHSFPSE